MRYRFDGFTAGKQGKFFAELAKSGCLADAARVARVSRETVRRWRRKDVAFAAEFERCVEVASGGLERLAWDRATVGVEEKIWRNGKLWQVRLKPSDAMLRLLMMGANPKKYGRLSRGGETKKQMEKRLRKEVHAELQAKMPRIASNEEMLQSLIRRLQAFGVRVTEEKLRSEARGEAA